VLVNIGLSRMGCDAVWSCTNDASNLGSQTIVARGGGSGRRVRPEGVGGLFTSQVGNICSAPLRSLPRPYIFYRPFLDSQ
jgi:hypothetical protein